MRRRLANPGRSERDGFVLLEVVVALVIVSVAGAAVLSLVLDSRRLVAGIAREDAILLEVLGIADSVSAAGGGSGAREADWGRVEWSPEEAGVRFRVRAPDSSRGAGVFLLELSAPVAGAR